MRATELIAQLQELVEKHGDLPITMETRNCLKFKEVEHVIHSPSLKEGGEGDEAVIIIDYDTFND